MTGLPPRPPVGVFRVDPVEYPPGRSCWVYRAGAWHPAVVLYATVRAATVRYQVDPSTAATAVDTVTGDQLHPWSDPAPEGGNQP